MKNIVAKRILKVTCFAIIFALLNVLFSFLLVPKVNIPGGGLDNASSRGFYAEPVNSIDIVVIGNSDAYFGFSPLELWNTYGYSAYVAGEGNQIIAEAYNMLKEVLSCQKPKLVILETDGICTESSTINRIKKTLFAAMREVSPLLLYHDRWKKVKPSEMLKKTDYSWHCSRKGQNIDNTVNGYTGPEYMIPTDKTADIPVTSTAYLDLFIALCRDNDIQLMFLEIPSQYSWNYEKHNAVAQYAEANGIPFLDADLDRDKFDFDWTKDTKDGGNHLNSQGARKLTAYVGKYISSNYSLEDHREDPDYVIWHEDYKEYLSAIGQN